MACHATDGPSTTGPARPSMAPKSAIDGPAGPVVAGDHLRRDRGTIDVASGIKSCDQVVFISVATYI